MHIIHFSDFHLDGSQMDRAKTIVKRMLESLLNIHKEKPIDLIVFSGDMIERGGTGFSDIQTAFNTFREIVIEPILKVLDIPHNRFVFTIGNHDVNRKRLENDEEEKKIYIKNAKDFISEQNVDKFVDPKVKLLQVEDFNQFRDSYWEKNKGEAEINIRSSFQYCVKLDIGGIRVGINCMNTVWKCAANDKNENGEEVDVIKEEYMLGRSQITEARDFLTDCQIKLAMAHHEPSKLVEFEQNTIKKLIAKNYDIYFSGHTHDYYAEYNEMRQGKCLYVTSSATTFKNNVEPLYKNGFDFIDYHQDDYAIIQNYLQDINGDFVLQDEWKTRLPSPTSFRPMENSLLLQQNDEEFLQNEVIEEYMETLKDEKNRTIQLVALSGLGKTRILQEAFKAKRGEEFNKTRNNELPNHFYCENSDEKVTLIDDLIELLREKKGGGVIILDDCSNELFERAIRKRNEYNTAFQLIGVNNEVYNRQNMSSLYVKQFVLTPGQLHERVDEYVDTINSISTQVRESIKKIADGFPGMAVHLVEECKKNEKEVDIHMVDHIVRRILKFKAGGEGEVQKKVLCTLALFQPFPYSKDSKAYKFIRENKDITNIFHKEDKEVRNLFYHTINMYDSNIVEISGEWLTVRPFPLAIWLIEEWFKDVDEERMEDLIKDIQGIDESIRKVVVGGLCKRLEYMRNSNKAQELFQRLTSDGGLFCNENVVCSDLGSRLILAMSSVNPGAVADCLYCLFIIKDVDWVKNEVYGDVRRNLVWALEKLCFSKDSYSVAVKVLALFAVAENETWANNATGQLRQLFHYMLPGTEADLNERIDTLRYLKDCGEQYKGLTLDCIDIAFDDGQFSRDGYGAKAGLSEKKDYVPTNMQVVKYWEECRDILQEWIKEDESIAERIAEILTNHTMRWTTNGMLQRMFPLIQRISDMKGGKWEKMYTTLNSINNKRISYYPQEFLEELEIFKQNIMPKAFYQKLKDVRTSLRKSSLSHSARVDFEKEKYQRLVQEFIEDKIYSSYDEIREMVIDKEYVYISFSNFLEEKMTDDQLKKLLDILLQLINEQGGDDFKSNFVSRICYVFRENNTLRDFIQNVYRAGYHRLYVLLLSFCETESMLSYDQLKQDVKEGRLTEDEASCYIERVSPFDNDQVRTIMKLYRTDFPNHVYELMNFITNYQYDRDILKDPSTLSLIKQVTLDFPIDENQYHLNFSYSEYVKDLLEVYHDEEYAVKLNKKMIEAMSSHYLHSNFEGIYTELLKDYRDAIWNDFETAFVDEKKILFYFQIRNELGSGFSFGIGPLFQSDDGKIKEMCAKYPDEAPLKIAEMVPIFNYADSEQRFSDWFLWLLDEYADKEHVLNSLHANMNSFSWTGSIVPLLYKEKTCFEKIKNHKRPEVRKWVEACIRELDGNIRREENKEAYDRFRYE